MTIIQQRKKRDTEQIPKRKKKIGNNISDIVLVIIKLKTVKNNTKTRRQRIEIEWLRTGIHGGHSGHCPVRNITVER